MRALFLVMLLSLSASAADDAPVVPMLESKCYSPDERANIAKALAGKDAKIKALEDDAGKSPALPIVVTAVLAIGAGFAIGFGVAKSTQPK